MVSIVEIENYSFLPYSNWPYVDENGNKFHFGPQMAQNKSFIELLSPNLS